MNSRRGKYDLFRLWTGGAVALSLVLSIPGLDTALSFNLRELMMDRDYQRMAAGIMVISFAVEYLLLRVKRWPLLKWPMVILSLVCLILAEGFWLLGGWDQIVGVILWWFGFPVLLGEAGAVLVTDPPENRKVRTALVLCLAAAVILGLVFWPRALGERMILDVEAEILLCDTEGNHVQYVLRNPEETERMLHYAEVIPVVGQTDLPEDRYALIRLNGEFIAVAEYGRAPYVCFYSGELEDYEGGGVKWRFFHFPALYTELIGWAESTTEERDGT